MSRSLRKVHPIAYHYPAERPGELFFPTVHDGGRADPEATYGHVLYAQGLGPPDPDNDWEIGALPPGQVRDVRRSQGLAPPDIPLQRGRLLGRYPNSDIVMLGGKGQTSVEARYARADSGVGLPMGWGDFRSRMRGRGRY
jgi:hypothetical protein